MEESGRCNKIGLSSLDFACSPSGCCGAESRRLTLLSARPLSGLRRTGESLAADRRLAKRFHFDEREAAGVVCKAGLVKARCAVSRRSLLHILCVCLRSV